MAGVGRAIRKDSLPLERVIWPGWGSGGGEACRRLGGAVGKSALQGENCKAEQPPWSIPPGRAVIRKENPC